MSLGKLRVKVQSCPPAVSALRLASCGRKHAADPKPVVAIRKAAYARAKFGSILIACSRYSIPFLQPATVFFALT